MHYSSYKSLVYIDSSVLKFYLICTLSSLFDVLRNEARVMEGLHSLGIVGLSMHNVLKLNIQPSDSDYAVDIRSTAISVSMGSTV